MNYRQLRNELADARGVLTNLNESAIRNIAAATLVAKVDSLSKQIQALNISKIDNERERHMKIFRQNKLLSKQHLWISVLIAQMNIMVSKKRGR